MIKKVLKSIKRSWKKLVIVFIRESRETKRMLEVYMFQRNNKELMQFANRQLVDIFKILFLFPITLLPGSVIIVTLLEIIAKAFGATIFPKKTKF
ncbi:hypothetical protein [Nitratiruptor tergarcus]|nr:hypothetical protein [Nitratiruptor tergarcus]